MKKVFFQGIVIISSFLITWFAFRQVNWMKIFKVQSLTEKSEKKLGEVFWEIFRNTENESKDSVITNALDSMIARICSANGMDEKEIKLHILESDNINAFALPDAHLVVYTGLLEVAESPEEVAGVLGHELGHIKAKHVLNKLIREVGLNTLISISAGNAGGEIIKKTAKQLSSSAFDRALEKEADIMSVDFMVQSGINPLPFASFLERLAKKEGELVQYTDWLNTHPDSKERAAYIRDYVKTKGKISKNIVIISQQSWEYIHHKN